MNQAVAEKHMFVVEDKCEVDDSFTSGVIIIEHKSTDGTIAYSDNNGLRGPDCRRLAIAHAARLGLSQPGVSGSVDTYPVDEDGEEITKPKKQRVAAFRAAVPVTRKLF